MIFRAIWPITDDTVSWSELAAVAKAEVPSLAAQAHARLAGPGRFLVVDSRRVPGSGGVTREVLLFEAPAREIDRRPYRQATRNPAPLSGIRAVKWDNRSAPARCANTTARADRTALVERGSAGA